MQAQTDKDAEQFRRQLQEGLAKKRQEAALRVMRVSYFSVIRKPI